MSTRGPLSELLGATGLSMAEFQIAEQQLVDAGLLRVNVDSVRRVRQYMLLNPETGKPLDVSQL